jgi:hypothetical protein
LLVSDEFVSDSKGDRQTQDTHTHTYFTSPSQLSLSLSLSLTHTYPNVSTDGNFLTITFRFAILRVPKDKHNVITAGNPSGIAATPSATATLA